MNGIGPLKKGDLAVHGYKGVAKMTELARHRALMRVIRSGEPPLSLFRKLTAVMVYTRKTSPKSSKAFDQDRKWLSKKFKLQ
jgi:hypothetical protein